MDALRKAEYARQEVAEASAGSVVNPKANKAPAVPVGESARPDLSLAPLESCAEDLSLIVPPPCDATATSSATPDSVRATAPGGSRRWPAHGTSALETSRIQANAVFQSKRAVPPCRANGLRSMLLTGALLVVLVAGAGAYLYLMDDSSRLVPPGQVAHQRQPAEEPTLSGPHTATVDRATAPPLAGNADTVSAPSLITPALRLTPESALPALGAASPYATQPEATVALTALAAPQAAAPPDQAPSGVASPAHAPVRVLRSVSQGRLDGTLRAAWEAFMQGDVARARDGYQNVLAQDKTNRDGLLGMAAVEIAEGNRLVAARYYRRLLERDPRDGAALEGAAALGGEAGGPDEQALRALSDGGGTDSGAAQFALGNLYAAQERWSDAQQAWFDAYRRAPENPDYAFNLAVSLEHLGQRQPALDHYRQALALAQQRPPGFDPAQAQSRIAALLAQGGDHGR
jgi:tetratricopeptide (TPR) repeat protein